MNGKSLVGTKVFGFLLVTGFLPAWGAAHNPLLPRPQQIEYGPGTLPLRGLTIRFANPPADEDRFAAEELRSFVHAPLGVGEASVSEKVILLNRTGAVDALPLTDEPVGPDSRESYRVTVTPQGAEIQARSSAALYYGVQTLRQLVEGNGPDAVLPQVEIRDWPSLAYRGFMMDTSHGALPTEAEIQRQIDFLARWKANQYYFYSEASIELEGFPLLTPGGHYTQEQIRRIVAYGRTRHVDIVPCMELYGHLHDLFRLERYADMAAVPHGSEFNPQDPRMAPLVKNWVAQLADLFPSKFFHIGFDEPWELERGGKAAGADPSQLFLGALKSVSSMVSGRGKRVLFWADIHSGADVLTRYPQLISQLPAGIIPVPWIYHALKDYTPYVEPLAKAHIPQIVAGGVWCWNEVFPDYNVTFTDIDGLLADGRKYGAIGFINTGWTDDAQTLYRMALPGMAYGAVAAWQTRPVDRAGFFSDYARLLYPEAVAAEIGPALEDLNQSEQFLENALGGETMHRFWDDPLEPARLERSTAHRDDLRQARLKAEDAQERLERALAANGNAFALPALLAGARMLDYLGMKNIYAVEIAGFFRDLGPAPKKSDMWPVLGAEISTQNHSRIDDLMDTISELRGVYMAAWNAEYAPYRLRAALGRWDAEYEYWRRLQTNISEVQRRFKEGDRMPPLESLRPRM